MKKILITLFVFLCILPAYAIQSDDLSTPADIENILGTGDIPEIPIQVKTRASWKKKAKNIKDNSFENLTYADLSLKKISSDVLSDLELEEDKILSDMETLWMGTAQKSETIRYAIYKLSNPDEGKNTDNALKKIIKPIASFSTIAGTALSANPYVATTAIMSGTLLDKLGNTDKDLNYQYTKVSDTSMVLLVRKIDKLQEKLLLTYLEYKKCEKIHDLALENLQKREKIYLATPKDIREQLIISDVYYREAQNFERSTASKMWSAKQSLIQLSGKEAFDKIAKPE